MKDEREVVDTSAEIPIDSDARLGSALSRRFARRFSRRSLLGQIGAASMVAAATLGPRGLVFSNKAMAVTCPGATQHCAHINSVTCKILTGSNHCPSNTCSCGYWDQNDASNACGGPTIRWHDCCGGCDGGDNCGCTQGYPRCCNYRAYNQGCLSGQCPHIRCRHYSCPAG